MKVRLVNENFRKDYAINLLKSRGITDIERYCHTSAADLQDWQDLDNINVGVQLVADTLANNLPIAIIVDADVDGYTSAAIMYQYLRGLSDATIEWYIHDGKKHGLSDLAEEIANAKTNYGLVIVPDAGSNDSSYAAQLSCPVLVIDHHILESEPTAENMVIINNQTSPKYRNKALSGAGMAFQFCRALDAYYGTNMAYRFLDLAALGICADVMSGLEYENQWFWQHGFQSIQNYFFQVLAEKQNFSTGGILNPTTVAFYIVPLINALIRVGTMDECKRLFEAFIDGHKLIPSQKRGAHGALEEIAIESARECTNAKAHQKKIQEDAVAKLEQRIFKYDLLENQILFIRLDDTDTFPAALNGLVATQLANRYKRPTIVARLNDEGYIRGSARGLSNSPLKSFKEYLNETGLFEYTAGHDQAFGISIPNDQLSHLHELANSQLKQYDFGDEYYDANFQRIATEEDIGNIILDCAKYRDVWSQGNSEPIIYITSLFFTPDEVQIMGARKDTIKIIRNGVSYIKFFANDFIEEMNKYNHIKMDLVGQMSVNEFRGMRTPQIKIDAFTMEDGNLAF